MNYFELYNHLKQAVNYDDSRIELGEGLCLYNYDFASQGRALLPGSGTIDDREPGNDMSGYAFDQEAQTAILSSADAEIYENLHFRYHIIKPGQERRSKGYIIFLHGFNEKYWDKYLPWAAYLARHSGKAVVLFPIAFHMSRAPRIWSDARAMFKLSRRRMEFFPNTIASTLSNVAISTRLHHKPQRFIWSGMQTYRDVIDLVEMVKAGQHEQIAPQASVDFWSYSIGTFLAQIILMSNENNYFDNSRLLTFCGGPAFNRLSPVSKFILDSEADVCLYSYLVEHLDIHIKRNESLQKYLNPPCTEGMLLRSMLNYRDGLALREDRLRRFSKQIYAIALEHDEVVPPYEVVNTLQGSRGDIGIKVDIMSLPFAYRHEDPLPVDKKNAARVDEQFRLIFSKFCEFLG